MAVFLTAFTKPNQGKKGEVTFLIIATFGRMDIGGRFGYIYYLRPEGKCLKEDKKIKICFLQPL